MKDQWFVKRMFNKFFLPSLMCSFALAVGAVVDSLYIGNRVGETGLFILGAASPVYMIYSMISIGISEGGAIHVAAALSEGKEKEGNRIFFSVIIADFILISLISMIGVLLSPEVVVFLGCPKASFAYSEMLRYVRFMFVTAPILFMQAPMNYFVHTDNEPGRATAALLVGSAVDCITGYLLIVVGNVGVCGSIWSTLAGAVVMESICFGHFIKEKGALRLKNFARLQIKMAWNAFITGFASAANYIYQFIILFVFNQILIKLVGTTGVAVFDIVLNVNSLVLFVVDAIIIAMIPLASTFYGEHNKKATWGCAKTSLATGLAFTGILCFGMALLARRYCGFSGLTGAALDSGALALRIVMTSMLFTAANMILTAFFQNTGLEKLAYIIVLARGIVVLLPVGILLSSFGVTAFWWCYTITEGIVLIFSATLLLKRKKREYSSEEAAHPKLQVFSETFVGSCVEISNTCERLQSFLEENGSSPKKAYFITLAVDETCRLIAENSPELALQLTLVKDEDGYVLHIRDNAAVRFNPFEINENDERALGLLLVKKQATDFYYRQFVGFNTLTIIFGGA